MALSGSEGQGLPGLIYVDADSCPFAEEIIAVVQRFDAEVIFVANRQLTRLQNRRKVQTVLTGLEYSAVDDWIQAQIGAGDVLLTADLELAKAALSKGAKVYSYRGKELDFNNIHEAVAGRELSTMKRVEKGDTLTPVRKPTPVSQRQKSDFKSGFHNFLSRLWP